MHSILPGHRAGDAAAARHRGVRDRAADRHHLRAVARRPALRGLGPAGVYAICTARLRLRERADGARRRSRAGASERKPVSLETLFAGFRYVRDTSDPARRDLARPVRGAARRRHRAAADLRARHPRRRALGARAAALGAGGRGAGDLGRAGAPRHRSGAPARIMFAAVGMFGIASLVFALSTSIALSFLALRSTAHPTRSAS